MQTAKQALVKVFGCAIGAVFRLLYAVVMTTDASHVLVICFNAGNASTNIVPQEQARFAADLDIQASGMRL